MNHSNTPERLSVKGKVIEIFQKGGRPVIRMSVDPFYLDVPADDLPDAHLKDTVVIDGSLAIEGVHNDYTAGPMHTKT
jgi:hypothetical protein